MLDDIADMLGLVWRVQLDGSVWFGSYTWPASDVAFTYLNKQPDMAMVLVMPSNNQKVIEPGQTVCSTKVHQLQRLTRRHSAWPSPITTAISGRSTARCGCKTLIPTG